MPLVSARWGNEEEGKKCNVIIVMSLLLGIKEKERNRGVKVRARPENQRQPFSLWHQECSRFTSHG